MKWYERIAARDAARNIGRNFGHDCDAETFLAVAQIRANKARYYRVCKTCGRKTRYVRLRELRELSPTDKQNAVPYDETQAKKWWNTEYGRYLQSPTWRLKRQKVLERAK